MIKPVYMILIILTAMFTTGCWDAVDVKKYDIAIMAGYDYVGSKGQGKFMIYANFPVFGEAKEKSGVLEFEGKTPGDSRIDRFNKTARILTAGDLKAVLVSKHLASRGTEDMFDILFRNPVLGGTPKFAVFDGRIKDMIYIIPRQHRTVGKHIIDLLDNSPKGNFIPDEDIHNFRVNVITPGFNPVLPVIELYDKDKFKVSGAALFKKYKMVAIVNADDMRLLTLLRGEKKNGDILFELKDKKGEIKRITFEGFNSRSVKAKIEDNRLVFEIEIKLKGTVVEALTNFQFAGKEEHLKMAKEALEKKVQSECESFAEDLQNKYRVDAILLGKSARAKWPELVEDEDWDEIFCNSEIRVNVKVMIEGAGEVA